MKKSIITVICMVMMLMAAGRGEVLASASVRSCLIDSDHKNSVNVAVTGSGYEADSDGNYYLFALMPYEEKVSSQSILAGTQKQKVYMNFTVDLELNSSRSVLYRKFAVAVKQNGNYRIVSNCMYITNAEKLAARNQAFPKAASKKGLHIKPGMIEDAEDLGIKHAAVNICLDLFIASDSQKNSGDSVAYHYQGQTYWFRKLGCNEVDSQVKKLSQTNVTVSGILLLRNNGAGRMLIAPDAGKTAKNYYGFGTMDKAGTEMLEALMHFLGERYMNSSGKYGTIVNGIVGNEVNNYNDYNYLGPLGFEEYVKAYTRSFRICQMALRSVYSNARVYISLDHLWNMLQPHGKCFTSKSMLDAFAAELKKEGDINWNLAFHPYPAPLTDPVFWDDKVSDSDTTGQVTMKNLGYLTDYVSKNFRSDVRIILSEQGFTSVVKGVTAEKLQAAAYAYAYYLTEFNDKVDSFIMNRHVDHVEETNQGLYLGVWTNKAGYPEYAKDKKEIWDVFKYIDSSGSKEVTGFALKYIGASGWETLIPGFNWNRFSSMGGYTGSSFIKAKKLTKTAGVSNNLKFSYSGSASKKGSKTTVRVDRTANPNLYCGAGWVFTKKLDFRTRSRFACKIKVTGMKEKYAHVRVRFFSGSHVYEASSKVKGNANTQIAVDISKWPFRGSVDKIQIWVRPNKKTTWKKGAKIVISSMKQAVSAKK